MWSFIRNVGAGTGYRRGRSMYYLRHINKWQHGCSCFHGLALTYWSALWSTIRTPNQTFIYGYDVFTEFPNNH